MYQTDVWEPFNNLTTEQRVLLLTAEPMLYPATNYNSGSATYGYQYCASDDSAIRNRFTITWNYSSDSEVTRLTKMADPNQEAIGVCSDIASVYSIIYNSIGAKTYPIVMGELDHMVLVVKAQNEQKQSVYYMQDNEQLSYLGKESDIPSKYLKYVKKKMGKEYPF